MTRSPYAQKWRLMLRTRPRRQYREIGGHNSAGITLLQETQHMDKLLSILKSRKFWAAVVGVLMVFLAEFIPDFPLDAEQVTNVIYVLVAFILGTALEDGLARGMRKLG